MLKKIVSPSNLRIFFLALIFITLINFVFLSSVIKNGMTGDDWQLLFAYKTYDPEPLSRILDIWMVRGPDTTIQFYYIGLLLGISLLILASRFFYPGLRMEVS